MTHIIMSDELRKRIEARPNFLTWAGVENELWAYAIEYRTPCPGLGWVAYAKNGDKDANVECHGAFYDSPDHPEGAVEWAINACKQHLAKVEEIVAMARRLNP